MIKPEWVTVQENRDRWTKRLAVPGGWLYLVTELGDLSCNILHQSLVFVPKQAVGDQLVKG